MISLEQLCRKNIWNLAPYSSARNEYAGREARVFLDANENPYNQPFNRYPDPLQLELKEVLSKVKGVPADCIFLGNGSDEAIDLPYRCFCEPGIDNVVAIEPTYGMYKVCADINNIEYRTVQLDDHFQIEASRLLAVCDEHTKIIWLCSPNNPTGNNLNREEIVKVIEQFEGLVIVDEEHEVNFKQQDPAPRYNARNVAILMATRAGAQTLLGTATPSFESYYNAELHLLRIKRGSVHAAAA